MLCMNFTQAEKENLMYYFIQLGIDNWSTIRAGHPGWHAHGGHGSGRKWPIVFAGLMLDDTDMQTIYNVLPNVNLGEDQHTMYGTGWTGPHHRSQSRPSGTGWPGRRQGQGLG